MNIKKLAIVLFTVTALSGSVPAWEPDSSSSIYSSGYAEPTVELRHEIHHAVPAIEKKRDRRGHPPADVGNRRGKPGGEVRVEAVQVLLEKRRSSATEGPRFPQVTSSSVGA